MSYRTCVAIAFLLNAAVFIKGQATSKRGLYNLVKVINTYTGRSAFDYNDYGCWCGLGGSGTPKDAVDRCCQNHDLCYSKTSCFLSGQLVWTDQDCGKDSCQCNDKPGSCARQTCTCDTQFGECIREAPYNAKYKGIC